MCEVHPHNFRPGTDQWCSLGFLLWVPWRVVNQAPRFAFCWILWFVGIVSTGVVTRFAEVSRTFAESSSSVRSCSSKPSSSTNTIGGTPDVFVAFASIGSFAVYAPDAGFTVLLTSHMASACPLSISTGSGWLFQNCASVCCPCLRVLLVCLLESAISHIFQRMSRMFSKLAYQALTCLTFCYSGDAMVAREEFLLSDSASFGNVLQIRVQFYVTRLLLLSFFN